MSIPIRFCRKDQTPPAIEEACKKTADLLRRGMLEDFCDMLLISARWKKETLQRELAGWKQEFLKRSGRQELADLVEESFLSCQHDNEIGMLRGALMEAIIIACYGGASILADQEGYGWGTTITFYDEPNKSTTLYYECNFAGTVYDGECGNRSTVDFVHWDGVKGEFFECKVRPSGIGCKEIKYLQKLKGALKRRDISYALYFACAESEIEIKIQFLNLDIEDEFLPFGIEQIRLRLPA